MQCCKEISPFMFGAGRTLVRPFRHPSTVRPRQQLGIVWGHWSVYLAPQSAGGPFPLTVTGRNKIVLDDILIGDVWFASGQSNMEMPLNGFPGSAVVKNAAEEIRNANQPGLRLLFIPHHATPYPLNDFEGN